MQWGDLAARESKITLTRADRIVFLTKTASELPGEFNRGILPGEEH